MILEVYELHDLCLLDQMPINIVVSSYMLTVLFLNSLKILLFLSFQIVHRRAEAALNLISSFLTFWLSLQIKELRKLWYFFCQNFHQLVKWVYPIDPLKLCNAWKDDPSLQCCSSKAHTSLSSSKYLTIFFATHPWYLAFQRLLSKEKICISLVSKISIDS